MALSVSSKISFTVDGIMERIFVSAVECNDDAVMARLSRIFFNDDDKDADVCARSCPPLPESTSFKMFEFVEFVGMIDGRVALVSMTIYIPTDC